MTERMLSICITSVGLCSSLTGAAQAAAAYRAGLSRPREHADVPRIDPDLVEPAALVVHPAAGIAEGFRGPGRLIRMVLEALNDARSAGTLSELSAARTMVGLALAPDAVTYDLTPDHRLLRRLWEPLFSGRKPAQSYIRFRGREGWHELLRSAVDALSTSTVDVCMVIATDSLLEVSRLQRLAFDNRLKGPDQPAGLSPGEAACVVVLEREEHAMASGRSMLGRLLYAGTTPLGKAPTDVPEAVWAGRTLSHAIREALRVGSVLEEETGALYTDANGERLPSTTMGHALAALPETCPARTWVSYAPATSYGDTGTVAPALSFCMALRAFARGYPPGPYALITSTPSVDAAGAVLIAQMPP